MIVTNKNKEKNYDEKIKDYAFLLNKGIISVNDIPPKMLDDVEVMIEQGNF